MCQFFCWTHVSAPVGIEYLLWLPIKKKPPATGVAGALFSRTGLAGIPYREIDLALLEFAEQLLSDNGHLPCAMRHQEDDEEQQHAEHSAGETL